MWRQNWSVREVSGARESSEFRHNDTVERFYKQALAELTARPSNVDLRGHSFDQQEQLRKSYTDYLEETSKGIAATCADSPELYTLLISTVATFDQLISDVETIQKSDEAKAENATEREAYLSGKYDPKRWFCPMTRAKNDRYWRMHPNGNEAAAKVLGSLTQRQVPKFLADNSNYFACPENAAAITTWAKRHGLVYMSALQMKVIASRLRDMGLLKERPVEVRPNFTSIEPLVPSGPTPEEKQAERRKAYFEEPFLFDAAGRFFTEAQVDGMTSEQLGKLLPRIGTTVLTSLSGITPTSARGN